MLGLSRRMRIVFARGRLIRTRTFCTKNSSIIIIKDKDNSSSSNNNKIKDVEGEESSESKFDPYREVYDLNMASATRIMLSQPRKEKKFGFDFHLVMFIISCLPSVAVYLTALYSRSEMRRMEAEYDKKKQAKEAVIAKKAEEEAQKKEAEEEVKARERIRSDPVLLEVRARLDKLEETIKEIVVETVKPPVSSMNKEHVEANAANVKPNDTQH